MQTITSSLANPDSKIITYAASIISHGGIVVYPSDTSYGLAVNPQDPKALDKIFRLKGRDHHKPISSNVRDINMIKKYAKLSPYHESILKKHFPGPFTFILPAKKMKPTPRQDRGVSGRLHWSGLRLRRRILIGLHPRGKPRGIRLGPINLLPGQNPSFRIPGTAVTDALSKSLNIPYTATSANLSGQPSIYKAQDIIRCFQNSQPQPDLFLDAGDLPEIASSTVIDLTQSPPRILRQGSGIFNISLLV